MIKKIVLSTKEVAQLEGVEIRAARKSIQRIKDALGKSQDRKLTVFDYAVYNEINVNKLYELLEA